MGLLLWPCEHLFWYTILSVQNSRVCDLKHSGRVNPHERFTMQQFVSSYHVHWWNSNMGFFVQENATEYDFEFICIFYYQSIYQTEYSQHRL